MRAASQGRWRDDARGRTSIRRQREPRAEARDGADDGGRRDCRRRRARDRGARLRRGLQLRGSARPVPPARPRRTRDPADRAGDRDRRRVRAQPDALRADGAGPPTHRAWTLLAGARPGSDRTSSAASRCRGRSRRCACASSCSRSAPSGTPGARARSSTSAATSTSTP